MSDDYYYSDDANDIPDQTTNDNPGFNQEIMRLQLEEDARTSRKTREPQLQQQQVPPNNPTNNQNNNNNNNNDEEENMSNNRQNLEEDDSSGFGVNQQQVNNNNNDEILFFEEEEEESTHHQKSEKEEHDYRLDPEEAGKFVLKVSEDTSPNNNTASSSPSYCLDLESKQKPAKTFQFHVKFTGISKGKEKEETRVSIETANWKFRFGMDPVHSLSNIATLLSSMINSMVPVNQLFPPECAEQEPQQKQQEDSGPKQNQNQNQNNKNKSGISSSITAAAAAGGGGGKKELYLPLDLLRTNSVADWDNKVKDKGIELGGAVWRTDLGKKAPKKSAKWASAPSVVLCYPSTNQRKTYRPLPLQPRALYSETSGTRRVRRDGDLNDNFAGSRSSYSKFFVVVKVTRTYDMTFYRSHLLNNKQVRKQFEDLLLDDEQGDKQVRSMFVNNDNNNNMDDEGKEAAVELLLSNFVSALTSDITAQNNNNNNNNKNNKEIKNNNEKSDCAFTQARKGYTLHRKRALYGNNALVHRHVCEMSDYLKTATETTNLSELSFYFFNTSEPFRESQANFKREAGEQQMDVKYFDSFDSVRGQFIARNYTTQEEAQNNNQSVTAASAAGGAGESEKLLKKVQQQAEAKKAAKERTNLKKGVEVQLNPETLERFKNQIPKSVPFDLRKKVKAENVGNQKKKNNDQQNEDDDKNNNNDNEESSFELLQLPTMSQRKEGEEEPINCSLGFFSFTLENIVRDTAKLLFPLVKLATASLKMVNSSSSLSLSQIQFFREARDELKEAKNLTSEEIQVRDSPFMKLLTVFFEADKNTYIGNCKVMLIQSIISNLRRLLFWKYHTRKDQNKGWILKSDPSSNEIRYRNCPDQPKDVWKRFTGGRAAAIVEQVVKLFETSVAERNKILDKKCSEIGELNNKVNNKDEVLKTVKDKNAEQNFFKLLDQFEAPGRATPEQNLINLVNELISQRMIFLLGLEYVELDPMKAVTVAKSTFSAMSLASFFKPPSSKTSSSSASSSTTNNNNDDDSSADALLDETELENRISKLQEIHYLPLLFLDHAIKQRQIIWNEETSKKQAEEKKKKQEAEEQKKKKEEEKQQEKQNEKNLNNNNSNDNNNNNAKDHQEEQQKLPKRTRLLKTNMNNLPVQSHNDPIYFPVSPKTINYLLLFAVKVAYERSTTRTKNKEVNIDSDAWHKTGFALERLISRTGLNPRNVQGSETLSLYFDIVDKKREKEAEEETAKLIDDMIEEEQKTNQHQQKEKQEPPYHHKSIISFGDFVRTDGETFNILTHRLAIKPAAEYQVRALLTLEQQMISLYGQAHKIDARPILGKLEEKFKKEEKFSNITFSEMVYEILYGDVQFHEGMRPVDLQERTSAARKNLFASLKKD